MPCFKFLASSFEPGLRLDLPAAGVFRSARDEVPRMSHWEEAMVRRRRNSLVLMFLFAVCLIPLSIWGAGPKEVSIVLSPAATPRVVYGGERL